MVPRYMGASLTMIDRHYGHLARDGREHAIRLLDAHAEEGRTATVDTGGRRVDTDAAKPASGLSARNPRLAGPSRQALCRTRTGDPFLTIEKSTSQGVHRRAREPDAAGPQWTAEAPVGPDDGPQMDPTIWVARYVTSTRRGYASGRHAPTRPGGRAGEAPIRPWRLRRRRSPARAIPPARTPAGRR